MRHATRIFTPDSVVEGAGAVVADSGGTQETTFLQMPCLTLREHTERPVTIEEGANELISLNPEAVTGHVKTVMNGERPQGQVPERWDGQAAERIVDVLAERMQGAMAA